MRLIVAQCIVWYCCLHSLSAAGGEILILQPASQDGISRNERESERAMDKARQQAGKTGKGVTTIILSDDDVEKRRSAARAEEASQDARDYLRPSPSGMSGEGATVILRSVPLSESERMQQRARTYVVPPPAPVARKDCSANAANQLGMIGEGQGATRSGTVSERGSSNVNSQGQCR